MKKKISIFLITLLTTFSSVGQINWRDSVETKVKELNVLLNIGDTIRPEILWELDSIDLNTEIFEKLQSILTIPIIVDYKLDSLLSHSFLQIVKSDDNRLWIFSWYENTGGTFKSNVNLIHYRTLNNIPKCVPAEGYSDTTGFDFITSIYDRYDTTGVDYHINMNKFDGYGASFYQIYELESADNIKKYLSFGNGIGCMTCCYYTAVVIELTEDSINFNYPAFPEKPSDYEINTQLNFPDHIIEEVFISNYLLGSRCGNIEIFEFDPKNQSIIYVYNTDDDTPLKTFMDEEQKQVKGMLIFNGLRFIQKEEITNLED
jgi:hypothetical protein